MVDILNNAQARLALGALAGTGLGVIYGATDPRYQYAREEDRLKKTLASAVRGAILGAGAGVAPTLLGVKF